MIPWIGRRCQPHEVPGFLGFLVSSVVLRSLFIRLGGSGQRLSTIVCEHVQPFVGNPKVTVWWAFPSIGKTQVRISRPD